MNKLTEKELKVFSKKLKKCPFCGLTASIIQVYNEKTLTYIPGCDDFDCGGSIEQDIIKSPKKAVRLWNRRV